MELIITDSTFTRCTVDVGNGAGGSMAIFDTAATVEGCTFENSQGTAVLFQSSATDEPYQLLVRGGEMKTFRACASNMFIFWLFREPS